MQFIHTDEQLAIAEAIDEVIEGLGGTQIARSWASGDTAPGIALWTQLAELGLGSLRVPEDEGGMGGNLVDLALIFERLGYQAAPGPYLESMALLPELVSDTDRAALTEGARWTAAVAGLHPNALDAESSERVFLINEMTLNDAERGEQLDSITSFRKLSRVIVAGEGSPLASERYSRAINTAVLANASMLIGAGERLLNEAVAYAKVREQFGKPIGEYQALKHQLADVRVALSFARPLVWQAALSIDATQNPDETALMIADRDVSAAKIRAAEAAQLSARVSLQVHSAIGYTAEHDLSLWLTWVPALMGVWGNTAWHRDRVAAAILKGEN